MTQEFDSAALDLLNNAYGLSGIDAEQQTFLEDGFVQQLLPIDNITRRARADFVRGIFSARLQNSHSVAGSLQSFVDPYNPVNVHNGFPASIDPRKADIWLLGATVRTAAGPNVTRALLEIDTDGALQAMSDTAAGGGLTPVDTSELIAGWDDFSTFTDSLGIEFGINSISGVIQPQIRRRMSAGEAIVFRSETTAAAAVNCNLQFFIGPVALGQDLF